MKIPNSKNEGVKMFELPLHHRAVLAVPRRKRETRIGARKPAISGVREVSERGMSSGLAVETPALPGWACGPGFGRRGRRSQSFRQSFRQRFGFALLLVAGLWTLDARLGTLLAATVTGNLTDISLAPLNTKLMFAPTDQVLVGSGGLSAGPPRVIDTVNGAFNITLEAGDYNVSLPLAPWRQAFVISVLDTNATYNITNLMAAPRTYLYTNAAPAAPTGTVNGHRLGHFWSSLRRTNAVRIMAFGDSVGDAKLNGMLPALQGLLPQNGGTFQGGFHWNLDVVTNTAGIAAMPADTNWWAKYYWLSNTGQLIGHSASVVTTGNQTNVPADSAAVYYIQEPGAGSFKVSVSANAGAWTDLATVNAAGSGYAGRVTNFALALNYYRLKVEGLGGGTSGRVKVITGGLWNDAAHTLRASYNTSPGLAWNDWTRVSTNVTWPLMAAEGPDLVLCEEKSNADVQRTNLPAIERMWAAVAPGARMATPCRRTRR
jgi:hypothetical protein